MTNATLTVTITATTGPYVPTKTSFTAVHVTSQVTTVMVSSALLRMNVMTLSVVTTAPTVPTVSAIILTAATIVHALTDTSQPTMPTLSVLTSTNVLMEHTTGFQGNGHLLYPSEEAATGCVTSTSVMSHHAMPMHNSQIMLAHIPVLVATDISVIVMLVKTSTNVMQPCLVKTS